MKDRRIFELFGDCYFGDFQKTSSYGLYVKNKFTKLADANFLPFKDMRKGLNQRSYQHWLDLFYKLVPVDRGQSPLSLYVKDYEEILGIRPLWARTNLEKGFYTDEVPKGFNQRFAVIGAEDNKQIHYERELFKDEYGIPALVERTVFADSGTLGRMCTLIRDRQNGQKFVLIVDDLRLNYWSHDVRKFTVGTDLERLMRTSKPLLETMFEGNDWNSIRMLKT